MTKPETPPADAAETRSARRAGEGAEREAYVLLVSCATGVSVVTLADQETFVLGRGAEADVVVDDDSVSRRHAVLRLRPRMTVEDLGSTNGSTADGAPVRPGTPARIGVGSVLELGSTTIVLHRAHGFGAAMAEARPAAVRAARPDDAPVVFDPAMRRLYALLDVIAPSPLAVLVLGETGVGKEVFAKALHERSLRAGAAFLQINCAALPESILEAELFGFEKGAFTGAVQAKPGLFEAADGGTVFLDEIGELPPTTQAKLLRVLEGGEVMRLGSVKPKHVDVRFVSATNRDLRSRIVQDLFRADLFFRLNGVSVTLPPLRQRPTDIVPLARLFARRLAERLERPEPALSPDAEAALGRYGWPGNVRQLRNVVERAVVMGAGGAIQEEHLLLSEEVDLPASQRHDTAPLAPVSSSSSAQPRSTMDRRVTRPPAVGAVDEEKRRVEGALAQAAGNQSLAARLLGISRQTLINRLDEYGIPRPRKGREVP